LKSWLLRTGALPVLLFSVTGFLVMGYHPGAEDDAVYLASVKARLDPALFPHDAAFFAVQMRASLFDRAMAAFVRATGIPLAWSELLWQFAAIVLMLWACWSLASHLFSSAAARWAGTAAVSAMLTLPVAGTGIYLADQYLHPRNLASALVLFAVTRILARRPLYAVPLVAGALLLHPMMGTYGASFCVMLALTMSDRVRSKIDSLLRARAAAPVAGVIPFGWLFRPAPPGWVDAMRAHHWFWLFQWTWYEWLGALGPLALFWLLWRWARPRGEQALERFALAVLINAVFQQAVAMVVCGTPRLLTLATVEPMRYLHLVYVFMVLLGGALLGRHLLTRKALRWVVFLVVANAPMFAAQRALFPASPHLELPGRAPQNRWLQAFAWIRQNTPKDAYFALGPDYLTQPGEDMHGFRALAERSALADAVKDSSVLSKAPGLVPGWRAQVGAQVGWEHFQAADFERLRAQFGVGWALLDFPPPASFACRWRQNGLSICRIPVPPGALTESRQ
jgi:hypothetical protein